MSDIQAPEIQDYAIIGNGRSCALISRQGSIDWLCWPRFDSPSLFGGILDIQIGGTWSIQPKDVTEIQRKYFENTNVLATRFITKTGKILLTDFMPAFSEEIKNRNLHPEHELIRQIECYEGEAEIDINFEPRPNYGKNKPTIKDLGHLGLRIEIGQELIALHSTVKFDLSNPERAKASIKLKAGEKAILSLTYTLEGPAVIPPVTEEVVTYKLNFTMDWWRAWAKRCNYEGPYKREVIRSALVLKLLGYAPSGAFVAAATTSLPEKIGGNINWDYRYCWLRDASFTVRSLLGLGYQEEAQAFVSWMLHSTRLTLPKLKVVYDVYGRKMPYETQLNHLKGYKNSRPVQIGIAVHDQLQLDVYGEVIDGVAYYVDQGGKLDGESQYMVSRIGEYVCKNWNQKDSGIWEDRNDIENYTYSRLMCWAALDKILQMKKEIHLSENKAKRFEKNRDLIRAEIEQYAWNPQLNAYTSYLKGNKMDACMLLMPSYEFHESSSPRMQQTYKRIQEVLGAGPGLIYRYEKSLGGNEGAFLICSFWKIDFIARGGDTLEEGHMEFKQILSYANDLGLFSEEVEVETGKLIGNFPQAFTHLGLINAALLLKEKERR